METTEINKLFGHVSPKNVATLQKYVRLTSEMMDGKMIRVNAVQIAGASGSIGDQFSQEIKLAVKNIGGVSSVVATAATTLANYSVVSGNVLYKIPFKDAAFGGSVTVSVAANTLHIQATGENSKTIQWQALVSMLVNGYNTYSV